MSAPGRQISLEAQLAIPARTPESRLRAAFWAISGAVSVRMKIMGIVLALVLLLGLGMTFETRASLSATFGEQLEQRGVSITRDLAARSTDLILTNNSYALYQLIKDTIQNNEDVRYAFILDSAGEIIVHSFGSRFPTDLLMVNKVGPEARSGVEILQTEEGIIRDVAVPIFGGRAGVARVGMSDQNLKKALAAITERLLLATALVSVFGVFGAYVLTMVLTRPIVELVELTRAVSRGDLKRKAPIWAKDEIGQLSAAFNVMTENLDRSRAEVQEKEQMRTQLLAKVITAQEEERKRIARELHDETSQLLTSLMVGLKVVGDAPSLDQAKARVVELRDLAAGALDAVHDLALQLRPSVLDDLGLVAAIQRYIKEYCSKLGIQVDFQVTGFQDRRLAPETETALYRIVQEALTNVAKHSGARNVSVLLEHRGDEVVAIVEDDGRGFDVESIFGSKIKDKKLGLFGMEERASLMGGTLHIESSPGLGTTVFIQVPVEEGVAGGEDSHFIG